MTPVHPVPGRGPKVGLKPGEVARFMKVMLIETASLALKLVLAILLVVAA